MSNMEIPYKIYLDESEIPKQWYNMRADMKNKPAPLLNPTLRKSQQSGGRDNGPAHGPSHGTPRRRHECEQPACASYGRR